MLNYRMVKVTGIIVRKYLYLYGIDRILKFKAFNLFNIILCLFKIFEFMYAKTMF